MKPHIPRRLLLELTLSMLRHERRSLFDDTARMIASLPPPLVHGREHVPAGAVTIVANHYQRRDLWIGWGGSLLMQAAGRPIHWMVLRELRLHGREVPCSRRLFGAVAQAYGFVSVPADAADRAGHAAGVRHALRVLRSGEIAGFFPEGEQGHCGALSAALPGAAELACLLSRCAPLLPAALWEEGESLACAFGPPFRLAKPSGEILMARIADLLPGQILH